MNEKSHAGLQAINERYSRLQVSGGSFSCGRAFAFSNPRPGEVCVDLGSGKGGDVFRLAVAVTGSGYVVGIDYSVGMLEAARAQAPANVRFVRARFDALPLEDDYADLLISNCAINHASDKPAVWREVHRILKPGGRFVVSDIYALRQIPHRYRNDPRAVAECWAGAETRAAYIGMVQGAGFTDLRVLEESEPYKRHGFDIASFTISGRKPGPSKSNPIPSREDT
jgi:ubiquinone/menaquinone biosynthesis C-methylase UbiE